MNDRAWVKKLALSLTAHMLSGHHLSQRRCWVNPLYAQEYSFALDWDNLERLAEEPGRFICDERPLSITGSIEGATTKACIRDNRRFAGGAEMFWPFLAGAGGGHYSWAL